MKREDWIILIRLLVALTITGLYYFNINMIGGALSLFKDHVTFNIVIERHIENLSTFPVGKVDD